MKPYIPQKLPLERLDWDRLTPWISQANRQLGLYDGMLSTMINPYIFLAPLTTQEAVLSSRIEGTQATLREVMLYEAAAEKQPDRESDLQEVINYRKAMDYAVARMDSYPLSLNLIKEIHAIVLDSVRGKFRGRGEFRRVQNFIGAPGAHQEQARYVPPPPERIMEFLDNWEKYIYTDEKDPLVQLAIVHAQFEVIHPFVDGNGRVGRILLPLFLLQKKWLSYPLLYLSAYLETHRDEYYDRLYHVSESRAWEDWIIFFLQAIAEQAQANTAKARAIYELYEDMKRRIPDLTRSQYAVHALDALFNQPVFNASDFTESLGAPKPTAASLLNKLREAGVVVILEEGAGRRPNIFGFAGLLSIVLG